MKVPNITSEQIVAAFQAAIAAGTKAGNARILELSAHSSPEGKMLEACGGSILRINIDGRTKLGRTLSEVTGTDFSVSRSHGGGFTAHLRYELEIIPPVNGQEFSIRYDADCAAAKVLEEHFGAPVYAEQYID